MKQIKAFLVLAAIMGMVVVSGCTTNDVYDPDKVPNTDGPGSPLGEGFSAPSDFSWSMVNTVNLNVAVKDEFGGQYDYLIEVFTTNPLSDTSAKRIARGTTDYTYTAEVNVPKTVERLFIRQTDPKQRQEVYEYVVPEEGGTLNCKLYYTGDSSTKSLGTRSVDSGTSGWDGIEDPGYTEQTYDVSGVTSINEEGVVNGNNQLSPGSVCIIKSSQTFNKDIDSYNGANATVYVQGTWTMPSNASIQGIDIIVLNGGKITSSNGEFKVADKSSLTIQSGGSVDCYDFSTATDVLIKNFGTFHAKEINEFNTGTTLYNAQNTTFKVDDSFNIKSSSIYNHGTIEVTNTSSGKMGTNNDLTNIIANYSGATIKVHKFQKAAKIINDGFIEVDNINDPDGVGELYNNCTFIATNLFNFAHVTLDKGIIAGGKPDYIDETTDNSNLWAPVPSIRIAKPATFMLINGSIIKCKDFTLDNAVNNITGEGDNLSMLKANSISLNNGGNTNVSNILIELNDASITDKYNWKPSGSVIYTTDDNASKYSIATCGGYYAPGNQGNPTPANPTIPVIEDATNYTYAFEDRWPSYGDFDLNDIVLTLRNKSIETNRDGSLKSVQFQVSLDAVGASTMLGVGIRFLGLSENVPLQSFTVNDNAVSFENGQQFPTFILFNDAHVEFGITDFDDSGRPFINTRKNDPNNRASKTYNVVLNFSNNNLKASAFNINNIDLFVINKAASIKTKRSEVHVAGYAPTDLANTSMFGTENDNSYAGHYYLSKDDNLAWGIVLPTNFAWPLESQKITKVYNQFESWVTSGGTEDGEWYNTHNDNVYSNQ